MSRRMERSLATLITVVNALGLFGAPPESWSDEIRPRETTAIVDTTVPPDSEDSEAVTAPEETPKTRCVHEALVDRSAETVAEHDEGSETDARN